MKIHLVWLEPDSRYSLHLFVNYERKSYEYIKSYRTTWNDTSLVKVKRKSDINDYIKYLKSEQFVEYMCFK